MFFRFRQAKRGSKLSGRGVSAVTTPRQDHLLRVLHGAKAKGKDGFIGCPGSREHGSKRQE
jgi:hypothetical protein